MAHSATCTFRTTVETTPSRLKHMNSLLFAFTCYILTLDRGVNQRFLCPRRTSVNKRKQPCGWMEMVDVVKWYIQMFTWDTVSLSFRSEEIQSVMKSASIWLGAQLRQRPIERLRRRYGSIWQSVFVLLTLRLPPSVSLTPTEDLTQKNKREFDFYNQLLWFLSFIFSLEICSPSR